MAEDFAMQTSIEVLERLKKNYAAASMAEKSTIEGTFAFDTLSANAQEFERAYAEMKLMMEASFVQNAWGEYLTAKAAEHGIIRKAAKPAHVILKVTGTAGASVRKGSMFATESGVNFVTNEETVISEKGMAEIVALAEVAGIGGNVTAGTITKIPVSMFGVRTVINESDATDGYDEETDAALRERTLFHVRMPATSGNVYHYIEWAREVAGVGAARCIRLWNGPGTVKVIVVDINKDAPDAALIKEVYEHIMEKAPIGATLTVAAPTAVPIDIHFRVLNGAADIAEVKKVVTEYLKDQVFNSESAVGTAYPDGKTYVSYAHIGAVIIDHADETGVKDYDKLLVNGATANIAISAEEMPVVREVVVNA